MERLTPTDAAFLHLEDDLSAMHSVTLAVFAAPEPSFDDLRARMAERVGLVPRCSQRLVEVPLYLERPVWVDDPHFSVDYHIRHTAIAPGDHDKALAAFIGRVLSQRLDRTKPLWELWMVSGLADGRWGLLSKMHYAAIDGVSGTDVLTLVADDAPIPKQIPEPRSEPLPTPLRLVTNAAADLLFDPVERYRLTRRMLASPLRLAQGLQHTLRPHDGRRALRGPLGPHRRWASARLSLADLRDARSRLGGTTNDVVLAAMTSGVRAYAAHRQVTLPPQLLALVPVAITPGGAAFTNQVAALELELPVGLDSPLDRHATIANQTARHVQAQGAVPGDVLRNLPSLATATLSALGVRSALRVASRHRRAGILIVNVPGADHEISVFDRQLVETFPVLPLADGVRLSIGAVSHGNTVCVGVTGDWDSTPDLDLLTRAIEAGLAEL